MTNPATKPVVVGIDGSDSAIDAARWAGAVADRFGAPLHIVYALPVLGRNLTQTAAAMTAAMMSYQQDCAELYLKAAADAVRSGRPDLTVTTASVNEPADEALIEASREARLVVLGGKSVTPAAALLLGSISLSVATRAACPVVAFRGDRFEPGTVRSSWASTTALQPRQHWRRRSNSPSASARAWPRCGRCRSPRRPRPVSPSRSSSTGKAWRRPNWSR